jgi:hypothetical protein
MPADAVVSRESKSLQEELTASRRERLAPPASTTDATAAAPGAAAVRRVHELIASDVDAVLRRR